MTAEIVATVCRAIRVEKGGARAIPRRLPEPPPPSLDRPVAGAYSVALRGFGRGAPRHRLVSIGRGSSGKNWFSRADAIVS
ncbi:hypothetical protein ABLN68_06585 [Mycobacterium tuberculosis]